MLFDCVSLNFFLENVLDKVLIIAKLQVEDAKLLNKSQNSSIIRIIVAFFISNMGAQLRIIMMVISATFLQICRAVDDKVLSYTLIVPLLGSFYVDFCISLRFITKLIKRFLLLIKPFDGQGIICLDAKTTLTGIGILDGAENFKDTSSLFAFNYSSSF